MTKVSFYVLQSEGTNDRLMTACRIADKALRSAVNQGAHTFIYCPDAAAAHALDDLLWTWKQGSFVAHERLASVRDWADAAPVIIGDAEPPPSLNGVLINLGEDVPLFFSRFDRVAEIIDPASRDAGRLRYQFYKDRGYPLETHKLDAE